ncbi:ATP-binding protein [Desulfosediminicola flagellatus]|uniref:hybrid sensor histidine kinase/response regulator n=1 Tax=Desulfosediminicola flagellatus TaxID=2569541 RepID=UPI0010ABD369|nr:ATP-binding protein [Desulfosediminicola flagellatus]
MLFSERKVSSASHILLTVSILCVCFVGLHTPCSAKNQRANILVLHSYHVGYKWTDEVNSGILSSLTPMGANVDIHVEYMDMKRYYSEDRYDMIFRTLSDKYKYIPIDYVISSDDTALIFLKKYGKSLFPGAIVSFCGANYLNEHELEGYPNFFGVTEEADVETNVTTLLKIHPDTTRIYIINDITVTGRKVRKEIDRVVDKYKHMLEFIVLDDVSLPYLLEQVSAIPPKSLILFSLFLSDKYGQTYEYYEVFSKVYDKSPVPIYGLWDFYFGHGLVGGMVTNGYSQGKAAGDIVIRLIQDGPSANLQRLYHSPNVHIFDYNILISNNINPTSLPIDSLILNFPVSFYQKHKQVLLGSAVAIVSLLVIIIFLIVNIYRRKVAEKKLFHSEKNFRSIFENATEGLFQTTREGQFLKVNPSLARMLGFETPEETIAYYTDIRNQLYVHPEERDQLLAELAAGRKVVNHERQMYCKDGSIITVLHNIHELHDESGNCLYLEGSLTDITKQQQTEAKLRQAQKMEVIGTLAGGIAHDFNNILSALTGYTQLALLLSEGNQKIHNYLTEVEKASKRAKDLVSQILAISRRTESEKHPLQISLIVSEALKLLRSSIPSSIEIVQDIQTNTLVVADSTEIHQVIMNLCTNAYHAMQDTGGTLSVTMRDFQFIADDATPDSEFPSGQYLHLEISDTGTGMDKQTLAKIFEPYFTTKEAGRGTGLGLAVVHGIVNGCGGFIRVYSEPGQGTTFNIYFPVFTDTDTPVSLPLNTTHTDLKGGNETILLIDDEEDVLHMHRDLLETFGYTVEAYDNSHDALRNFFEAPDRYHLVITDLTMPGMTGEQLGAEILATDRNIPVIVVSGFSGAMNRSKFIEKGYSDFIQKPVDVHEFLHRIREILDRST